MIVGELLPDAGSVTIAKDKTLGYLAQHQEMTGSNTIYQEVRTAKAHIFRWSSGSGRLNLPCPTLQENGLKKRWRSITG